MNSATVGLLFVGGLSLLMGLLAYFPRGPQAERDAEAKSWSHAQPMSDVDRVFRQRAYVLSRAAPVLIVVGVVSVASAVVLAFAL